MKRRSADRRKYRDVADEWRLANHAGLNRLARWQIDRGEIERRDRAARQVLEHLALETVVIGRVRRATRNTGCFVAVVVCRVVVRTRRQLERGVEARMRCDRVARQVQDPRQQTQRGPGERDERTPCDAEAPASASPHARPRATFQTGG